MKKLHTCFTKYIRRQLTNLKKVNCRLIVVPMTTKGKGYPTRISCSFQGKQGQIVLDQIRTIDKTRIQKVLGKIDKRTQKKVFSTLYSLFSA